MVGLAQPSYSFEHYNSSEIHREVCQFPSQCYEIYFFFHLLHLQLLSLHRFSEQRHSFGLSSNGSSVQEQYGQVQRITSLGIGAVGNETVGSTTGTSTFFLAGEKTYIMPTIAQIAIRVRIINFHFKV